MLLGLFPIDSYFSFLFFYFSTTLDVPDHWVSSAAEENVFRQHEEFKETITIRLMPITRQDLQKKFKKLMYEILTYKHYKTFDL